MSERVHTRNRGDNFPHLKPICNLNIKFTKIDKSKSQIQYRWREGEWCFTEDSSFASIVETEDEDPSFFVAKHWREHPREQDSHLLLQIRSNDLRLREILLDHSTFFRSFSSLRVSENNPPRKGRQYTF